MGPLLEKSESEFVNRTTGSVFPLQNSHQGRLTAPNWRWWAGNHAGKHRNKTRFSRL